MAAALPQGTRLIHAPGSGGRDNTAKGGCDGELSREGRRPRGGGGIAVG